MTIKKSNEQTIGEAFNELLKTYRLESKFSEAKMISSWEKIVGKMIAQHTINLSVKKRVLFVNVDSAALRNELNYAREKIKKALNKEAGEELIDEVVLA